MMHYQARQTTLPCSTKCQQEDCCPWKNGKCSAEGLAKRIKPRRLRQLKAERETRAFWTLLFRSATDALIQQRPNSAFCSEMLKRMLRKNVTLNQHHCFIADDAALRMPQGFRRITRNGKVHQDPRIGYSGDRARVFDSQTLVLRIAGPHATKYQQQKEF